MNQSGVYILAVLFVILEEFVTESLLVSQFLRLLRDTNISTKTVLYCYVDSPVTYYSGRAFWRSPFGAVSGGAL